MAITTLTFSVLTPSYNAAGFIGNALASVDAQTGPVEHIVMDGGSTDGTVDLLAASSSGGLHWTSEPDAGQSDALNKAFALATGDIIGWLNADEWYLPGALEVVRAYFDAHPEADVVYGEYITVTTERTFVRAVPQHRFSAYVLKGYGCYIPSCATFVRRSALPPQPWDPTLRWVMDWDLWLQLLGLGRRFFHTPHLLSAFTVHPGQVTAGDRTAHEPEFQKIRSRHSIPAQWAGPWHRRAATLAHGLLKLTGGAYMRQWTAGRRLQGSTVAVASSPRHAPRRRDDR